MKGTKGISKGPEGVLVLLRNKLNLALSINTQTLKLLIDRHVTMRYGRSSTKAHYEKVNDYNDLSGGSMTIKVLFKYLRIIQVKKVTFTLTVVTARDKEVTVSQEVLLAQPPSTGETDDED